MFESSSWFQRSGQTPTLSDLDHKPFLRRHFWPPSAFGIIVIRRFIPESPGRTRVELEHRNIDRHGPGWEAVRDGVATDQGWPLYLDRYAALLAAR